METINQTIAPKDSKIFYSLLQADFAVQWRNRRALLASMLVPVVLLVAWRMLVKVYGGPFVFSTCITIGLVSVGLMGFANTTARDREKGIFQRLRITPASTRQIMVSRILVQLAQMLAMVLAVFILGFYLYHVNLGLLGYLLGAAAALIGGAVYLGLGQAVVGLISSADTVNSVSRFVYIILIVAGTVGELGVLGSAGKKIVLWSPYGTVKMLLLSGMTHVWNSTDTWALLATIGYLLVFVWIGIKWFHWNAD